MVRIESYRISTGEVICSDVFGPMPLNQARVYLGQYQWDLDEDYGYVIRPA